jgi:transcriptional regulator with PAS, ATPase and Fis domain
MLAIKTGSPLFQESGDGKGWIYSVPVTSSATLCIGFSRQKFEENQRHERRHYVYAVLLVFIAVSLALFALYHRIAQRVARLLSSIESAGMASVTQRISVGGDDEFAVIASRVNDLLARLQGEGRSGEEPLARSATLLRLLKEISALSGKGIMVADSDNRVIYAADEAVKFFSLPVNGVSGKHLLDIFRQPVLLTLLKASGTYPGVWQEGRMDDRAIQVLSVPGKRDATSATIIALR